MMAKGRSVKSGVKKRAMRRALNQATKMRKKGR